MQTAEKIVGKTKFFLVIKKIPKLNKTTKILLWQLASDKTPTGNIIVRAISAANVAYAKQLNHLNTFDVSFIFTEDNTPKNLDAQVANEVTIIDKRILIDTFLSN